MLCKLFSIHKSAHEGARESPQSQEIYSLIDDNEFDINGSCSEGRVESVSPERHFLRPKIFTSRTDSRAKNSIPHVVLLA